MLSHQHPIGRVKDADNTPYNYCFIAPIPSSQLTTGEFVTCEIELGNERELIYGRIKNRRTINPYPDTFFLDPLTDPATIAETSDYPHENYPLLKITVTIIGYFDNELKEFINPRIGPISGTPVYLAISKELERLFNKTIEHHYDQVWIGKFPNRPTYVSLDAVTLARTHVAILSGMGARETHFVMGIISSTFNYNAHAATLLIDTRNKYGMTVKALDLLSNHPAHQYPNINTYTHRDVKIDLASLSLEEIKLLLPDLQKEEAQLLQEAFYSVQQDSKTAHGNPFQWTLSQLLKRIGDLHQLKFDNHTNIKEQDYMVGNLRSYLSNIAKEAFISEDEDDVPPRELYLPDQCSTQSCMI